MKQTIGDFVLGMIFLVISPMILLCLILIWIRKLGSWWRLLINIEERRREWNSRLSKTKH